ncbi:hypothetical protein WDU94_013231 [Cyamophila willieti]
MEKLVGHKSNGFSYVHNQHIFRKNGTYYKCSFPECPASCKVSTENIVKELKAHNHHPDLHALQILRYKNLLRQEALTQTTPQNIVDEVAMAFPQAASDYHDGNASQLITAERRRRRPVVPNTSTELQNILRDPQWASLGLDSNKDPFFREVVTSPNGSKAVIFISQSLQDLMCRPNWEAHCDATFACRPAKPEYAQVFTLHAVDRVTLGENLFVYPVLYALMEDRTAASYRTILEYLSTHVEGFQPPGALMADFELAIRAAFRQMWPDIAISGCHFHYCQALWKKATSYRNIRYELLRGGTCLKLLYNLMKVLPLLPATLIREGMAVINREAENYNKLAETAGLREYMESYWLETVGSEVLSVAEAPFRTNNAVEGFYSRINRAMKTRRPDLYTFLGRLQSIDAAQYRHRQSRRQNRAPTRERASRYTRKDQGIARGLTKLREGEITVREYLFLASEEVSRGTDQDVLRLYEEEDEDDVVRTLYNNIEQNSVFKQYF